MPRTILFLCPHNAAKSVIAASLCARELARRGLNHEVDSAGTEPDAAPAPAVVALLAGEGFDVGAHRPRRVGAGELAGAWKVISLGCDVSSIAPPGLAIEHWNDVPAPSQDLAGARERIGAHVDALVASIG